MSEITKDKELSQRLMKIINVYTNLYQSNTFLLYFLNIYCLIYYFLTTEFK